MKSKFLITILIIQKSVDVCSSIIVSFYLHLSNWTKINCGWKRKHWELRLIFKFSQHYAEKVSLTFWQFCSSNHLELQTTFINLVMCRLTAWNYMLIFLHFHPYFMLNFEKIIKYWGEIKKYMIFGYPNHYESSLN